MRIKVIACDVLNREISYLASQSEHFIDVTYLPQGLHDTPEILRSNLLEQIAIAEKGVEYHYYNQPIAYDCIVLGYCLCCNGTVGLSSSLPLVIPRGHDCITLLLGSKERYKEYFDAHPGTFFYSRGWIERSNQPSQDRYKQLYNDYAEKYGEDNAEYLMQLQEVWLKEYHTAAFIDWQMLGNGEQCRAFTKTATDWLKWSYEELDGDCSLMQRIINGDFRTEEVLVVPPGKTSTISNDNNILKFI